MIAPIDFSAMFRASVAEKLRVAGDIDEDAAEALAETLYAEWAQTPDERLNGLSPRAWFARLATPEALTELLTAYARENVEIPELLLERFDDLGAVCAPRLEALARNVEAPPIARAQAFDLLLGFDGERAMAVATDAVLAATQSGELVERAAEALGERAGTEARERLLAGYAGASEFAQMLILEILCNFSGDERIYTNMVDMFRNRPEKRAFAAKLLGRYGDARAVEPLRAALSLSDLTYFEYLEIRNAIEALGEEVEGEREFYGDPDYEYLRGLN